MLLFAWTQLTVIQVSPFAINAVTSVMFIADEMKKQNINPITLNDLILFLLIGQFAIYNTLFRL